MSDNLKIKIKVFSLIPNDIIQDSEILCDYFAFKSSYDVNTYIGNDFNFDNFLKKDFSSYLNSSFQNSDIDDNERFLVYIYPGHKSMFSYLSQDSYLDFYQNGNKNLSISLPDGGVLKIINKELEVLQVELITHNIINRYGN